jgi:hypothetical protein
MVLKLNDLDSGSPIGQASHSFIATSHRYSLSTGGGPFQSRDLLTSILGVLQYEGEEASRNGRFQPYDAGQRVYEY